jgi:murein DD-endopeptidase MepM/ murein hydrolase activator NlpD
MRLKLFSVFGLGFASGMVTLALALWASGRLHTPVMPVQQTQAATELVRGSPPPRVDVSVPPPVELESSRTGKLAMPIADVDSAKLVSNFAEMHGGRPHEALDIMAPRGTPVRAVDEGNVVKLFTSKEGGLTVYQFDNSRTRCYYYAHLDRYATGLREGMLLRKGEVLGYVGSTGNAAANAPHLHFAVFILGPEKQWWKGTAIDPLPLLQGHESR